MYTYIPRDELSLLNTDGTSTPSVFDDDVWVLLVRHLSDTRRVGEYIALIVDDEGPWTNADATADGFPHLASEKAKAELEVKVRSFYIVPRIS